MKQADCGIFPARAEGWNLELLEMMSCGKHVIATNYSAHTEFCNKDNCMLVEIDSLEKAEDGVFFSGEYGEWASISESSKDQIIEHMRKAHSLKQAFSGSIPNPKGVETAKSFTWSNSTKELLWTQTSRHRGPLNLYKDGFVGSICDEEDTKALLGELPMPVFGAAAYDLHGSGEGKLSLPFKCSFDGFGRQKSKPQATVFHTLLVALLI